MKLKKKTRNKDGTLIYSRHHYICKKKKKEVLKNYILGRASVVKS